MAKIIFRVSGFGDQAIFGSIGKVGGKQMNWFLCAQKSVGREGIFKALLPEGLLDYFMVTSIELKDKEYSIYLEELNVHPEHFKGSKLTSKGFYGSGYDSRLSTPG